MGLRGPHGVGDVLLREIAKEPVLTKALEGLALALRQGFAEVRKGLEPREDAAKRRSGVSVRMIGMIRSFRVSSRPA